MPAFPVSRFLSGAAGRLAGYAAITGLAAVASFLITPLLVQVLGFEGFGEWSLLEPLLFSIPAACLLGVDHGVLKRVALEGMDLRTALGAVLPHTALVLLLAGIAAALSVPLVWDHPSAPLLAALLIPAEAMLVLLAGGFRASDRLAAYGAVQVGRTALNLAVVAAAAAIVGPGLSVSAVVSIRLVVAVALALPLLLWLRPMVRFDSSAWQDGVRYGSFIVISSLVTAFGENFDRYSVGEFHGMEATGRYVVSVKLAAIVGQGVTMPLMMWFPAERFRHLNDPDGGERFFRVTAFLILALLLTVSGVVFLYGSKLTTIIGRGAKYSPVVLAMLLTGVIATGMAHPLNIGLLKPGRSHLTIVPVMVAGVAGFAASRIVVPWGGLAAAAAVKAATLIVAMAVTLWLSQKHHPVRFHPGRLALLAASAVVSIWVLSLSPMLTLPAWLRVMAFLITMCASSFLIAGQEIRGILPGTDDRAGNRSVGHSREQALELQP